MKKVLMLLMSLVFAFTLAEGISFAQDTGGTMSNTTTTKPMKHKKKYMKHKKYKKHMKKKKMKKETTEPTETPAAPSEEPAPSGGQ
jgi:hypothetical protein